MRTLRQCLWDCDLALLRVIAAQWGVELATNRREDAVSVLAAHMADATAQAEMWSALSATERQALGALLSAEGKMPAGTFARRFGEIRPMGPGRLERERPWESPISAAESLWYRGLIYKAFDQGPGALQEIVFVPPELAGFAHEHHTFAPAPIEYVGQARLAGAQLTDDLCSLLAFLHARPLPIAPGELLPARLGQSLSHQLRDRDPIRLQLLVHLAAQLSLVKPKPLRPDPRKAMGWLQAPTAEQQRALFEGWRDSVTWNDLWRVPSLHCEETGSWHNDPLAARSLVLDLLTRLEVDAWYRLQDFIAAIHEISPDFQRPGGDYDTWYIRDAVTNQYLAGFASWDQVEGALLRFIINGPLHWLGMVDLDVAGTAFRVTPLGRWLLGGGDAPQSGEETSFVVCPDGQVQVGAARRYDRFQLARVADWVSSGDVYTFRLTPSALERARAQRIDVNRILDFLARASGAPVPEALANALRRWEMRGTEMWAQHGVLVRVARPNLLDQLVNSPRTRKYIRETLSSTTALVAPQDWPHLAAALLEMGVLPETSFQKLPRHKNSP